MEIVLTKSECDLRFDEISKESKSWDDYVLGNTLIPPGLELTELQLIEYKEVASLVRRGFSDHSIDYTTAFNRRDELLRIAQRNEDQGLNERAKKGTLTTKDKTKLGFGDPSGATGLSFSGW